MLSRRAITKVIQSHMSGIGAASVAIRFKIWEAIWRAEALHNVTLGLQVSHGCSDYYGGLVPDIRYNFSPKAVLLRSRLYRLPEQ
jgi:hypothetical protein